MLYVEKFITQIGELMFTEVDDISKVSYIKDNDLLIGINITMESGKKFVLEIKTL